MSLSTPAERLEPILTWIDAHRDAAVATLQRFCRQPEHLRAEQGDAGNGRNRGGKLARTRR